MKILTYPAPELKQISRRVDTFDHELTRFINNLFDIMKKNDGRGIAAPQVGILKRIIIVRCSSGIIPMINPVITKQHGEFIGVEGCLSIPGKTFRIKRALGITVEFQNRRGSKEMRDFNYMDAVCVQHEVDHLNGITLEDKV